MDPSPCGQSEERVISEETIGLLAANSGRQLHSNEHLLQIRWIETECLQMASNFQFGFLGYQHLYLASVTKVSSLSNGRPTGESSVAS
jgi:hypothetical protein